ncbi:MAG TPA: hypothetical protein PLR17_01885 [Acetomicrobium flavidum]|uniref:LptA/OstA family protein n=2 Tax=Acetomicrobium flavidum TaxID=49896 RepID=UPI002B6EE037|nr:hypothetical protein [Acetomicrobium flavidum]HOP87349.1 hypothetical protein [Acetomicrobium flavidum]
MKDMKALYGFLAFVILIAFFLSPPCVGAEKNATTEVTLRSDELYYDPNSGKVTAKGSVEVTREDLVVKSPFAEGFIDGREFRFWNGVDASWPSREANLTCLELKMTKDERGTLLRASGKSHMIRGKDEEIRCNDLEWLDGKTIYYSAMGNVNARMKQMEIVAERVTRRGDDFDATQVQQFRDKERGVTMSAQEVKGKIKDELIDEMWARGNVVIVHEPKDGERTNITGDQAHYIRDKGVLEVSGNAKAVQEGKTIEAESLVYYVEDRHIEALGRPKVVVEVKEE